MRGSGFYSLVCIIGNVFIYGSNSYCRRIGIDSNIDAGNYQG